MNTVTISGRLARDPELHPLGTTARCYVSVAVEKRFRDERNQIQTEVSYINCDAWGRTAKNLARYVRKGRTIIIHGALREERWQDNGKNKSTVKVIIERFEIFTDERDMDVPKSDETMGVYEKPGQQTLLPKEPAGERGKDGEDDSGDDAA